MSSPDSMQKGLVVHIYGSPQRYGILRLIPENALVYFKVERIFLEEKEVEGDNVVLSSLLEIHTPVTLTECDNILRINPRKNYASVDLLIVDTFKFRCVNLEYSVFMGGLASSQVGDEYDESTAPPLPPPPAAVPPPALSRATSTSSQHSLSEFNSLYTVDSVVTRNTPPPFPVTSRNPAPRSVAAAAPKSPPLGASRDSFKEANATKNFSSKESVNFDVNHYNGKPVVASKTREFLNSSFAKSSTPVQKLVDPPQGYTYLEGNIAYVQSSNSTPHGVRFKYNGHTLLGCFYIRYVSINGSRICDDEYERVRKCLRVGMPACVIHFSWNKKADPNEPYLAVVNLREEVLFSKEWQAKPVDGICAADDTSESIWDIVDVSDPPPKELSNDLAGGSRESSVSSGSLPDCNVAAKTKDVVAAEIPDGFSVNGVVESFDEVSCAGVATFKHHKQRHATSFTLTEVTHGSDRVEAEQYGEYVKIGTKVWLTLRKAAEGSEHNYEADGLVTVAKIVPGNIGERVFDGVVVETIDNEGKDQPRVVSISIDGRKETVFVAMKNVKVDDRRAGRAGLPAGFCKVGTKVKVSHLKEYNKTCKYEGVVNFRSADFAQEETRAEDEKLHFTGWDAESTGIVIEVRTNDKGRAEPKIVAKQVGGKTVNVVVDSVTMTGRVGTSGTTNDDFDFVVGVIVKLNDVKQVGTRYHGVIAMTEQEASLYDTVQCLDVSKQNEVIQWSVKMAADGEGPPDEEDEDLEIPAVFSQVASGKSGANTVRFTAEGTDKTASVWKDRTTLDGKRLDPKEKLEDFVAVGLKVTITKLEPLPEDPGRLLATIQMSSKVIDAYWENSVADSKAKLRNKAPKNGSEAAAKKVPKKPEAKVAPVEKPEAVVQEVQEQDLVWAGEVLQTGCEFPEVAVDQVHYEGAMILRKLLQSGTPVAPGRYKVRRDIMDTILGLYKVITEEHIYQLCMRLGSMREEKNMGVEVRRCLLLQMVCAIAAVVEGHVRLGLPGWNSDYDRAMEEIQRAIGLRIATVVGAEITSAGEERDTVLNRKYTAALEAMFEVVEQNAERAVKVVGQMKTDEEMLRRKAVALEMARRRMEMDEPREVLQYVQVTSENLEYVLGRIRENAAAREKKQEAEEREREQETKKTFDEVKRKTEDVEKRKKAIAEKEKNEEKLAKDVFDALGAGSEEDSMTPEVENAICVASKYGIWVEAILDILLHFEEGVKEEFDWFVSALGEDDTRDVVHEFLVVNMVASVGTALKDTKLTTEQHDALKFVNDALLLQVVEVYDGGRYKKTEFGRNLEKYLNEKYKDLLEAIVGYVTRYETNAFAMVEDLKKGVRGNKKLTRQSGRERRRERMEKVMEFAKANSEEIEKRKKEKVKADDTKKGANGKTTEVVQEKVVNGTESKQTVVNGPKSNEKVVKGAEVKQTVVNGPKSNEKVVKGAESKQTVVNGPKSNEKIVKGAESKQTVVNGPKSNEKVVKGAVSKEKVVKGTGNQEQEVAKGAATLEKLVDGTGSKEKVVEGTAVQEEESKAKVVKGAVSKEKLVEGTATQGKVVDGAESKEKVVKVAGSQESYDIFMYEALKLYEADQRAKDLEKQAREEVEKKVAYDRFVRDCMERYNRRCGDSETGCIPSDPAPTLASADAVGQESIVGQTVVSRPEMVDQATQTVITGNIMFFQVTTE